MTATPKVSVSIITYNQRDYIAQAIDSALMQETDFPVRIHIGDDFSNDGTRDILREYRERYPDRIVLNLQPERPMGVPGRANNITNLKSCDGEYIAMLDGDDYWTDPHKLQSQVDFLDAHSEYGGAAHDSAVLDADTGHLGDQTLAQLRPPGRPERAIDIAVRDVLEWYLFQTSSFVFRRDHLALPTWFDTIHAADFALFLMVAARGPIRFVPETRSVYRHHEDSIMARSSNADWATRLEHDWPIFFREFPASRTFRQRMKLLRAQRISALTEGRYAGAARAAARLVWNDPAALPRLLMEMAGKPRAG